MRDLLTNKRIATGLVIGLVVSSAGVAVAANNRVKIKASGPQAAQISCPGGLDRLGHPFDMNTSVFPGDPAIHIDDEYTVAVDFFKVEDIATGAHAGTHIDVPEHFIEEGRSLDEFAAEEFIWPAYKIDVRGLSFDRNEVTIDDIIQFEAENGRIQSGSLVILQTGAEDFFGLDGPGDRYVEVDSDYDEDGNPTNDNDNGLADNIDDLFAFENAGFAPDAVQWLFDNRQIDGVGSDAYGPDAAPTADDDNSDDDFDATFTTLANDGVALVAIANLDTVSVRGDIIMAPAVNLTDGSGFSVDPLACHGGKD